MKLLLAVLTLTGFILLYSSCQDEESPATNEFILDGTKYSLARGFLKYDGPVDVGDDTYHLWELTLTSSAINWNDADGWTGQGDLVQFYLYAANDDSKLPPGTYSFVPSIGGHGAEAKDTVIAIGFNVEVGGGGTIHNGFEDVEVKVSRSGSSHTITLDITTTDDEHITGGFKGELVDVE